MKISAGMKVEGKEGKGTDEPLRLTVTPMEPEEVEVLTPVSRKRCLVIDNE